MTLARRWQRGLAAGLLVVCGLAATGAQLVNGGLALGAGLVQAHDPLADEDGGPLIVTDRHGTVLRRIPQPQGGRPGRDAWVPLSALPAPALLTLLASEDKGFFTHDGIDGLAVLRAAWLDLRAGRAAYGASTLTMQLVRLSSWPAAPRTLTRKLFEAGGALALERRHAKHELLEHYLNRAYYGNGAHGLDAAARVYLDKPAAGLSVGEAVLLSLIPRAPSAYDPRRHLPALLARREHVFGLLRARGLLDADEIDRARTQPVVLTPAEPAQAAGHFVDWVLAELPAEVRARGGVLRTTLDLELQRGLERDVSAHVRDHAGARLEQAGVVVLDSQSGEVLAMVGASAESGSQINITTWRRHPGSALKPFVYALAIEDGDTPATIAYDVFDVPSAYRAPLDPDKEHGPVRYREALAGSYNLAAVHVLEKLGVARLLSRLNLAGLDIPGSPDDYGLRLALGAAKVRLVDLAAAYGFLVRGGRVRPPRGVVEVTFAGGARWVPAPAVEQQLFSPEVAWQVMDMLADPVARRPMFGWELPIDLPFPAAVKTGTSRGFADTVAVGVTSELTVAAWGGRFDGEPTAGLRGMQAAAPLVRAGLLRGAGHGLLHLPPPPPGLVAVTLCARTGELAEGRNAGCTPQKRELIVPGSAPAYLPEWHHADGRPRLPAVLDPWAARQARRGGREAELAATAP